MIVALLMSVGTAACDGEVEIDCTTRGEATCPGHECAWTSEGCRNSCQTDDDCPDGTACEPATFVPVEGTLEEWASYSGLACAPG